MGGLGRPRCCLPPLSPFFAPLFWGSQGWGHPGSISEAEGERCPALPWLRALPSTLPGRPAPMWHRSGPISSIFLDVEFVSLRLHPRSRTAPSLLRPAPRPYFSRGYGGTKALAGWGRGDHASCAYSGAKPESPTRDSERPKAAAAHGAS